MHGFYRSTGLDGSLRFFGVFVNGHPVGKFWQSVTGGGYLHGSVTYNDEGQLVIHDKDACFLYPDLNTVLRGQFHYGQMTDARRHEVSGLLVRMGILHPDTHPTDPSDSSTQFRRESRSMEMICEQPRLADPYEERCVYVDTSTIPLAGQGLFAKRYIRKGQVVAYFNGVGTSHDSDYSIKYEGGMLDIPLKCRSVDVYRATLAHKICHSFEPNAAYGHATHPRFGLIRSAVAERDIEQGEEVFCDYKYSLSKDVPEWYVEALQCQMSKLGMSKEQIDNLMKAAIDK